jgi:ppGpp synthetase/RelA/SpoT-type nucleotidyltranferase
MTFGGIWRPETLEEFKPWYAEALGYDDQLDRDRYEAAGRILVSTLTASPFWVDLGRLIPELAAAYEIDTGFPLFVADPRLASVTVPGLLTKPFDSVIEKAWRKNCLENSLWPNPPEQGWLTPENWYDQISDLVRTTLVVKYLDGVAIVRDKLEVLARDHGVPCRAEFAARPEGYYAAHVDVGFRAELPPRLTWDTVRVSGRVEIQITTQLQEVIRRLLHQQYESDRVKQPPEDWEWDYRGDAFRVNYLGHVLHYLEGKIMDERERRANVRS